jgi:hypothetical protein
MQKAAIKDLTYGGLEELINNRAYYHHSNVGAAYSHFTDDGKAAVLEFIELIAAKIKDSENEDLDRRAKQQVIDALKGDK